MKFIKHRDNMSKGHEHRQFFTFSLKLNFFPIFLVEFIPAGGERGRFLPKYLHSTLYIQKKMCHFPYSKYRFKKNLGCVLHEIIAYISRKGHCRKFRAFLSDGMCICDFAIIEQFIINLRFL